MKYFYDCKKSSFRVACTLLACVSLLGWSCVDNDFQLDNISGEITIGEGNATFPLGFLPEKTIGDLIGEDVDGLTTDQNGDYSLSFSDSESLSLGGFSSVHEIQGSSSSWDIDYPSLVLTGTAYTLGKIEEFTLPDELSPSGGILPSDISTEISKAGVLDYDFKTSVPKEVKRVNRVYFGDTELGSRIDMDFDLNGLAPINKSGTLNVTIQIPEKCIMRDSLGKAVSGTLSVTRQVTGGSCRISCYVESIDTSDSEIVNNEISLNESMPYEVSYQIQAEGGISFDPADTPTLDFTGVIEYKDADIVTNAISVANSENTIDSDISLDNIPDEVASINRISFTSTSMVVFVDGLEWLGNNISDLITVTADMPAYFEFAPDADGYYNAETHRVTAPMTAFIKGVVLDVVSADFGSEGLVPDNGRLNIGINATVSVSDIPEGTEIMASELDNTGSGNITVGIRPMTATVESIEGKTSYTSSNQSTISIGSISDYDIDITNLDVSPVITVNISNSISIPIDASLRLVPERDGAPQTENTIEIDGMTIVAAEYAQGRLEPGLTRIVIAENEPSESEPGVTTVFKECDLSRLFRGSFPESISVEFEAATDPSKIQTIYAADTYDVTYDYNVDIPLDFGDGLDISYSEILEGLHESVFSELSGYNISVDEIKFFVEVDNSTPFDLSVDLQFYDMDGQPSTVKAEVLDGNDTIYGSEDGAPRTSTVAIGISNPNGTMNTDVLQSIDGIGLTLKMTSSRPNSQLNEGQSLAARLSISVPGGITLDINDLIGPNKK